MKIETPWSTEIVDKLGLEPPHRLLMRLWIVCDRALWFCVGFGLAGTLAWLAK